MNYTSDDIKTFRSHGLSPLEELVAGPNEVISPSTSIPGWGFIVRKSTKQDANDFVRAMKDFSRRQRRGQLTANERESLAEGLAS